MNSFWGDLEKLEKYFSSIFLFSNCGVAWMNRKTKWSIYVTDSRQTANWIRLKDDRLIENEVVKIRSRSMMQSITQLVSISPSNWLMCFVLFGILSGVSYKLWILNAFETANVHHYSWKFTFSGNLNANSFRVFFICFICSWNFVETSSIFQTLDEMVKVENVRELNKCFMIVSRGLKLTR